MRLAKTGSAMNPLSRTLIISLIPALIPVASAAEAAVPAKMSSAATEVSPSSRASKIIGTNLKNANDETVGEIEDLIVDLKSGDVLGVVVSSGGFLGVADTLTSLPSSALRYDAKNDVYLTALTKEQLQQAPNFKKSAWPDMNTAALGDKLRQFRDSIGGDVTAPDNSAQNEKDVHTKALTPMDQGSSDADIKTTKDIRAAIVDTDLSFNTKNVKVITRDGKVTLRGVVSSEEERNSILAIAKQHAEAGNITDDTEVKTK